MRNPLSVNELVSVLVILHSFSHFSSDSYYAESIKCFFEENASSSNGSKIRE